MSEADARFAEAAGDWWMGFAYRDDMATSWFAIEGFRAGAQWAEQRAAEQRAALVAAIRGLMEIAEMAMPDSYFQSDSRVNAARAALGELVPGEGER